MRNQLNITPAAPFIQPKEIEGTRIHPVKEDKNGVCEKCDDKDADFYTVYVKYKDGEEHAIFDCQTKGQALACEVILLGFKQAT